MIHIRLVSPLEITASLVESLASNPDVLDLIVLEGVARNPDGDAVQFDVINAEANGVLQDLRTLGVDRTGSIVMSTRRSSASRSASTRTSADGFAPVRRHFLRLLDRDHRDLLLQRGHSSMRLGVRSIQPRSPARVRVDQHSERLLGRRRNAGRNRRCRFSRRGSDRSSHRRLHFRDHRSRRQQTSECRLRSGSWCNNASGAASTDGRKERGSRRPPNLANDPIGGSAPIALTSSAPTRPA